MPATEPPPPTTAALSLSNADRRRDRRFAVERPGKIFRRATQQYAPVTTRNLSLGGALLDVDAERPFASGELVELAVAFSDRALVPSSSLVRAIVTRVHPNARGRQTVAVRYIRAESPAAAA